jgi:AcrR family transcriptional regulator
MRSPESRPYQMRRRAEQISQTRQRIVEATVALHGSVGPAATTIAAIADMAKVTRLTVYRHFPDETALFNACSAHWMSRQRPPDPDAWAKISDPAARLRAGLADLYRFYRAGADMLAHIYRDFAALPEAHQQRLREQDEGCCLSLAAPFPGDPSQRRLIRAVIGHAASFWTWHSLCTGQGLTDQEATEAMTSAVLAVTPPPPAGPGTTPPSECSRSSRDRSGSPSGE